MGKRGPEDRRDVRELRGKVRLRPDYDHKRLREGYPDAGCGEAEGEISEEEWLNAAAFNPAFAFLD